MLFIEHINKKHITLTKKIWIYMSVYSRLISIIINLVVIKLREVGFCKK